MMYPVRLPAPAAGGTTSPFALRVSMLTSFQAPTKRLFSDLAAGAFAKGWPEAPAVCARALSCNRNGAEASTTTNASTFFRIMPPLFPIGPGREKREPPSALEHGEPERSRRTLRARRLTLLNLQQFDVEHEHAFGVTAAAVRDFFGDPEARFLA